MQAIKSFPHEPVGNQAAFRDETKADQPIPQGPMIIST
jgi:hypothetical protein